MTLLLPRPVPKRKGKGESEGQALSFSGSGGGTRSTVDWLGPTRTTVQTVGTGSRTVIIPCFVILSSLVRHFRFFACCYRSIIVGELSSN